MHHRADHAVEYSRHIGSLQLCWNVGSGNHCTRIVQGVSLLSEEYFGDVLLVAVALEIPVMTVRTRLFYARKELFAKLANEESLAEVMTQLMATLPGRPKARTGKATEGGTA